MGTYDRITRETMFNVVDAVNGKITLLPPPLGKPLPMAFVSCAEAGWPNVQYGEQVEEASPDWLKRYLAAKRAVEAKLAFDEQAEADHLPPIAHLGLEEVR